MSARIEQCGASARPAMLALVRRHWSAAMAGAALAALIAFGATSIDGFWSLLNLRSNLVFASFLGIATIGQTLCALIGGLDLSIPFVLGAANVGLVKLINLGVPPGAGIVIVLALGAAIGAFSGALSHRLREQSLVVTLGVGSAVLGLVQILVSKGGVSGISGGTIEGKIPRWIEQFSSFNHAIGIAPAVILWVGLIVLTIVALRRTWFGRSLYALGGNRTAAERVRISSWWSWTLVFGVSGATAALTGVLLLGYTGSGYAAVGAPYLFTTIAAVLIGGTSLVGGRGGYGLSVLGVLILTVLQTILSGYSLTEAAQEAILGSLIIPTVALYARSPHPRSLI
ncbi:MAG: ABC transporter permease [Acetobacteraceae bacterium]